MDVFYVDFNTQSSALLGQPIRVRKVVPQLQAEVSRKKLLLAMSMLFVVLAIQLGLRIYITERGYEIERMRMIALSNDTELRELDLAYALKTRPNELAKLAKTRLEMEPLTPSQIRKVSY